MLATETKPSPAERIATPTTVLWEDKDPIFPFEWSDQLDIFFQNYTLERLSGTGHFTPLEATDRFAEAIHIGGYFRPIERLIGPALYLQLAVRYTLVNNVR
jgi:hypothetical protein